MPLDTDLTSQYEFMRPLVDQWTRKIELARKSKGPFQAVGDQCEAFFAHSCGFMWKPDFLQKIGKSIAKPKFEITINKAFELVAIFGPYLYWKYPHRKISSPDRIELPPELFGQDEMGQMEYQQAVMEEEIIAVRTDFRNKLMEKYLNYSQREQPHGGLAVQSELAITDALVRGRGILAVKGYTFPGSDKMLTGGFHESVNNFFVDPDAKDPMLKDAKWIAIRHESADWELEDKFNLPRGLLKGRGHYESMESRATNVGGESRMHRTNGQSNDQFVWYEIWSKGGVGSRMNHDGDGDFRQLPRPLHDAFDDAVGDYAYLCVCPATPWPLNAPSGKIRKIEADQDIAKLFRWRAADYGPEFPAYKDHRWPVAILDFYRIGGSAWPVAPLSPCLGELTALNVLMSALVEQGYENRKSYIAYLASAKKYVEAALKGSDNPALIELNETAVASIDKAIQFLNRPDMNKDILTAIDYLMELFDKRSGLTEIHYAMNVGGVQSRTARDAASKEEKASIRPEKMSNDVARWQSEEAQLEKMLAGLTVWGESLVNLLGPKGAQYWDEMIAMEDPEAVMREMTAMVEASDVRRPNKERVTANMQQILQFVEPLFEKYAELTGDSEPINKFLIKFGESIDEDFRDWRMGPWREQPDPEQQQAQQQMMEMEQMKLEGEVINGQLEVQKAQAEIEKAKIEAMKSMQEGEMDSRAKQMELAFDQAEHQQEMRQDEERFGQEMVQDRAKAIQDLMLKRMEARVKARQMEREGEIKAESAEEQAEIKTKAAKEQAKIQKNKPATNGAKA